MRFMMPFCSPCSATGVVESPLNDVHWPHTYSTPSSAFFANDQKVFVKVVPEAAGSARVDFVADVPLKVGNNVITVFAREDEEFQSRRSIFVYRRGPAEVAAQQQPAKSVQ